MGSGLADHLTAPDGAPAPADAPYVGAAGGAVCGDLVRVTVRVEADVVVEAFADASGCGAVRAAAGAIAALVEGSSLLDAARLTTDDVVGELAGISPGGRHGAELAVDALHRALGAALRDGAPSLPESAARTVVALSGGVDSAAAAHLSSSSGEEVVAVTLELWADPATDGTRSCCSPQAVLGARALAHSMGLPHFTLDLRERFRSEVVDDFLSEYGEGRTPNPCVRCNGLVRFDAMLDAAASLGAARLVTGHYARIAHDFEGPLVREAADPRKDQSYMLARLSADQLERLRFPLGGLSKPKVRQLAAEAGLPVAGKRESQDLCFAAGLGARGFLRRHAPHIGERGEVVSEDGRVLGSHDGHHNFTVGQRKGIGVSASEPLYVLAKDAGRNRLVVGPRSRLAMKRVRAREAVLHRDGGAVDSVRLRYHAAAAPCRVVLPPAPGRHATLELELATETSGVAPGQTAALMSGDRVVGAGIVAEETR
jgi:tRNA-uridine 2-sulfurtransferase